MTKKPRTSDIAESLEKLERIVTWLDAQEQVRVEEGLAKVKEGAALVKELKSRLKEVENEFADVRKELDADGSA